MTLLVAADQAVSAVGSPAGAVPPAQWPAFALCKGKTHLFFGAPGERPSKRKKRETLARSYCLVCPVMEPCRDAARDARENGLWGDENEEERAALGYAPRAPERRSVAIAARGARISDHSTPAASVDEDEPVRATA